MSEPGVPLGAYRKNKADVRVDCTGCALSRVFPLETVIARLDARGFKGEEVGIRASARLINKPCPRCGGTRFTAIPAFPHIPGSMGVRA